MIYAQKSIPDKKLNKAYVKAELLLEKFATRKKEFGLPNFPKSGSSYLSVQISKDKEFAIMNYREHEQIRGSYQMNKFIFNLKTDEILRFEDGRDYVTFTNEIKRDGNKYVLTTAVSEFAGVYFRFEDGIHGNFGLY